MRLIMITVAVGQVLSVHIAAAATVAGADFQGFSPTSVARTDIVSDSASAAAVNTTATATAAAPNPIFGATPAYQARARADARSVGVDMTLTASGGQVGATFFQELAFQIATPGASALPAGPLSIALIGSISGSISQSVFDPMTNSVVATPNGQAVSPFFGVGAAFYAIDMGDPADSSVTRERANLAAQNFTSAAGQNRVETFFFENRVGSFSQRFDISGQVGPGAPTPILTTVGLTSEVPREQTCIVRTCISLFGAGRPLQTGFFDLGLVLSARLVGNEDPVSGSVNAFNSLDIEAIAILDQNGDVIPAFVSSPDGAVDFTYDPNGTLTPAPIPTPGAGLLLASGLMALALHRVASRRKRTGR